MLCAARPPRRLACALLLALVLAGFTGLAPRVAHAATTTITNCSPGNLANVKAVLEGPDDIVFDCGVVTLDIGSEIVIDSSKTVDGAHDAGGSTTLPGGNTHRVLRVTGSIAGVTVTLMQLPVADGYESGGQPAAKVE